MKKILISAGGSAGTNNLIKSFQTVSNIELDISTVSTSKYFCGRSSASKNYIIPHSNEENYIDEINKIITKNNIDLFIPNSDAEVVRTGKDRDQLKCKTFLPSNKAIETCDDKFLFYKKMISIGSYQPKSFNINSLDDIDELRNQIKTEKIWIRPKVGAGSKAATWTYTSEQAKNWISLWNTLRGFNIEDFVISEFLPGRDFAVHTMWKDGELCLFKMAERNEYLLGASRLSGMSSTPSIATTCFDQEIYNFTTKAAKEICPKATGNFNFDIKMGTNGEVAITECNIGRFFNITPIFDRTGVVPSCLLYLSLANNDHSIIPENKIDYQKDKVLLRELDTEPVIIDQKLLNDFETGI